MTQRSWLASCNNTNEGQIQHFEYSTLKLPTPTLQTFSPPIRTHLQLTPLCCPAWKFYHSFIQTSCWRNAPLQSCPLDWSTDCNPRVCCAWLTIKKWPKLLQSYLDKEERYKTDSRAKWWLKDHLVVVCHPELGDKRIWPQRMFQVPEDIGQWQTHQTPCILFYLSALYLVSLEGLLEFHRLLCFLFGTTLCKHYLTSTAGEGVALFRKEPAEDNIGHLSTGSGRLLGHTHSL